MFLKRDWNDVEKWIMGVFSALLVAAILATCSIKPEKVFLTVARSVDNHGRCVDKEIFLENKSDIEATDITISFDVDYFTRRGDIAINYGDEKEQLITSVMTTLLDRKVFVPIPHSLNEKDSVITVPSLKPGQYLHLFYAGDTISDIDAASKRRALLEKNNADKLMDKPRVVDSSYKNGALSIKVAVDC